MTKILFPWHHKGYYLLSEVGSMLFWEVTHLKTIFGLECWVDIGSAVSTLARWHLSHVIYHSTVEPASCDFILHLVWVCTSSPLTKDLQISFYKEFYSHELQLHLWACLLISFWGLFCQAAVAQAALAFKLYQEKFSGPRWEALEQRGARKQRVLWASTSVKNPSYSDTLYVNPLIGPDTVSLTLLFYTGIWLIVQLGGLWALWTSFCTIWQAIWMFLLKESQITLI
jgi:hypothetical protein